MINYFKKPSAMAVFLWHAGAYRRALGCIFGFAALLHPSCSFILKMYLK
jgi:hypothetical protein